MLNFKLWFTPLYLFVAGVQVTQYEEQFIQLFTLSMAQLKQVRFLLVLDLCTLILMIQVKEYLRIWLLRCKNESVQLLLNLYVFQMLSLSTNIKEAYKHGHDDEQNFIQNLSLFLCTFLKEHGSLIEKKTELNETLLEALHYLILISEVEETEIFKICLEYWNSLASDLYRENPFGSCNPLLLSRAPQPSEAPSRRTLYNPVLTKVCLPSRK